MGLPDRKYSDQQRAAMIYVREQGHTYREVAEQLGREGCPALDVGPFDVPEPTLRAEVPRMQRRAAKRTPLSGPIDQVAEDVVRRMLTVVSAELTELESKAARLDLKRLDDLSKIAARLRAPTRKPAPLSDPESPEDPAGDQEPEPSPFMAQLAGDRPSQEADDSEAGADPDDVPTPPLGLTAATAAPPSLPGALPPRSEGGMPIPRSREEREQALTLRK